MKSFTITQRRLLKLLALSSGKLDTYSLLKRSRMNYSDFSKAYNCLINEEVISETDNYASLSNKGKKSIKSVFRDSALHDTFWKVIPGEFLNQTIEINSFYIPNISMLDKKTFDFGDNPLE